MKNIFLLIFISFFVSLINSVSSCPPGASSTDGSSPCTCLPGYTSSGFGETLVCTAICPVGSNCILISKRTSGDAVINLMEVELYLGATKLASSSLAFSMSSTADDSTPASKCNNGITEPSQHSNTCHTSESDKDAWLLINAGSQIFSRVKVYNRMEGSFLENRINIATLTMFNGGNVTTPAVTFSSLGSGLAIYTFCSTGCTGSTCMNSCSSSNYYNFMTGACEACPSGASPTSGAWSCTCLPEYASSGSGSSLICTNCPLGSSAATGSSLCTSIPGYYNPTIANLTNQIISLNDRIDNDILLEISKIKIKLQKLSATLTKLRKRDMSKKMEL